MPEPTRMPHDGTTNCSKFTADNSAPALRRRPGRPKGSKDSYPRKPRPKKPTQVWSVRLDRPDLIDAMNTISAYSGLSRDALFAQIVEVFVEYHRLRGNDGEIKPYLIADKLTRTELSKENARKFREYVRAMESVPSVPDPEFESKMAERRRRRDRIMGRA